MTIYTVCVRDIYDKYSEVKTGFFKEKDAIDFISVLGEKINSFEVSNEKLTYYIKEIEVR